MFVKFFPGSRCGPAVLSGWLLCVALPVCADTTFGSNGADPDAIRVLLSPELETTLVAPMQGTLAELSASLGSPVKKGERIVLLDCAEPVARLQMAEAEHKAARETLAVKTRLRELGAAGDMEVVLAQADVDRGLAGNALAKAQQMKCSVSAPFSGRVVKVHVKPFQGVEIGTPLVELVSDGPLKLRLNVPSRLLPELAVGTTFSVRIDETGSVYRASLTALNARIDPISQTLELEATLLDGHQELLPGMSGVALFGLPPDE